MPKLRCKQLVSGFRGIPGACGADIRRVRRLGWRRGYRMCSKDPKHTWRGNDERRNFL